MAGIEFNQGPEREGRRRNEAPEIPIDPRAVTFSARVRVAHNQDQFAAKEADAEAAARARAVSIIISKIPLAIAEGCTAGVYNVDLYFSEQSSHEATVDLARQVLTQAKEQLGDRKFNGVYRCAIVVWQSDAENSSGDSYTKFSRVLQIRWDTAPFSARVGAQNVTIYKQIPDSLEYL